MARQLITMTNGGLQGWVDELNQAADKMPEMMLESLKARQSVMEGEVLKQWIAIGGNPSGLIAASIGQSANYSKDNPVDVMGTVGVYNLDRVNNAFGRTDKDLNAAQIAYWVELGTSRLKYGGRKQSGKNYPEDMLTVTQPRPFISSAAYSSWSESDKAFNKKFNEEYERLVK